MDERIKFIHLLGRLLAYISSISADVIITAFYRSSDEQNALYQIGRTKPGKIVTNCDGYKKKSKHQLWRAVDLAVVENGEIKWDSPVYDELGEFWDSVGGIWGGNFSGLPDKCHFEI